MRCPWFRMGQKMKYFLTKTQESRFKFYLNLIWNHGAFCWVYINLNTKFEKLCNNKSKEQVILNLTSQHGVQKYFFIKKFNEIKLCEVIT